MKGKSESSPRFEATLERTGRLRSIPRPLKQLVADNINPLSRVHISGQSRSEELEDFEEKKNIVSSQHRAKGIR